MMLTIRKYAEAAGVGVETVRFYQRKGLLTIPAQTAGIRRYGDEELRQLRFIRKAQAAGFTLDEIGELIALDASHDRHRARELAEARLQALEAKITELQGARDTLQQLATECSKGSTGPCPILKTFGL